MKCHIGCKKCFGPGKDECLLCDETHFYSEKTKTCNIEGGCPHGESSLKGL